MPEKRPNVKEALESIVRLRRAADEVDDHVRAEIEPVLAYLEEAVGPTIPRAEAARLLGVSQTALDRWITKGEIAAVVTPRGRREVPSSQLVDLVDQLNRGGDDGKPVTLASVIRARRHQAEQIDSAEFLPRRRRQAKPRKHRSAELQALAYHRLVARRLDERLVNDARKRLRRWRASGRIHPRWAEEWEAALAMPPNRIAKLISSDTERARQLRQSSPFAGALNEQERRRVLTAVEDRATL